MKKSFVLVKYRFYPSFMYHRLDLWLKKMSLSGWHIVNCGFVTFYFEKGSCKEREYFTYAEPLINEAQFSILLRHPNLENKYGVKKSKSKINSNEKKFHNIIEIDTKKIERESKAYLTLIKDRNRLCLKAFLRGLIAFLLGAIIAAFATETG